MKKVFGHHNFRFNQREIINATMAKNDVFIIMPTGGGKSLCYQLPAICSINQGITVVVSPLLSLIDDQVMLLKRLEIAVAHISSDGSSRSEIMSELSKPNPQLQVLFVTPEMLTLNIGLLNVLNSLMNKNKLDRFVIDEAHCVSQWGHDFRKSYQDLGMLKSKFPKVPILAMTATATNRVKMDIMQNLSIKGCIEFTSTFNRINLKYEIKKKSKKNYG